MQNANLPQPLLPLIVQHAYMIVCQKIAYGRINIYNETSFQLYFSITLDSICKLVVYDAQDIFTIELEKPVSINKTSKSPNGNALCDVYISYESTALGYKEEAYIELKFFKQRATNSPTTENRFKIYQDLENLEAYPKNQNSFCFEVVLSDNKNYAYRKSRIECRDNLFSSNNVICNGKTVILLKNYQFLWRMHNSVSPWYSLLIKV